MNIQYPIGINDIGVLKAKQSDYKTQPNYENRSPISHFLVNPQKMVNPKTPTENILKLMLPGKDHPLYSVSAKSGQNLN